MNEWISIKNSLPNERQWVLVWAGEIYLEMFEGGIFYAGDVQGYYEVDQTEGVTHWMPLPPPPIPMIPYCDHDQSEFPESLFREKFKELNEKHKDLMKSLADK